MKGFKPCSTFVKPLKHCCVIVYFAKFILQLGTRIEPINIKVELDGYEWCCKAGAETSAVTEGTTDLLDSVLVYDLNGNGIPISDLWKDRKAVVAFARHFG